MNPRSTSFQGLRVNRAGLSPLASRFVATKADRVFPGAFPAKPGWRRSVRPGCFPTCSGQLAGPEPTQANSNCVDHLPPKDGAGMSVGHARAGATPRELKACLPAHQGNSSCTNA